MSARHALRLVQLGFSSGGKVLSQEVKAAENVFVKQGSHLKSPTIATRHASRLVQHRFCSSGKVVNEEEKTAENVFTKKVDQEKLEKLARNQAEYEELAQRAKALIKENESLRAEVLKEEITSLKAEVNRISSEYEKLHAHVEAVDTALVIIGLVGSGVFAGVCCMLSRMS